LALSKRLKPIKNVNDALRKMTQKKCIASGSDYIRIEISLKKTGTKQYFNGVFSSSSVKNGKPSPDVFIYSANQMGYETKNCIVIEDSKAGMEAGLAAGMKTFLFRPCKHNKFPVPSNVVVFNNMLNLPGLIN